VDAALLQEPAEKVLAIAIDSIAENGRKRLTSGNYTNSRSL
jgi:hypothetical protein